MTAARTWVAAAVLSFGCSLQAATITVDTSGDGPDEGFNDPTPVVSPVGGNDGTTLGQQRLNVFQAAADQWGQLLDSSVTIVVAATFDSKFCSGNAATLGSAGPTHSVNNFSGAPMTDVAYPAALGDSLAGTNLRPGISADISASFNSDLDGGSGCGLNWYYGLDGNPPGGAINLYSIVLHELAHGLGFASLTAVSDGQDGSFSGVDGDPDAFSLNLLDQQENLFWDEMNNSQRLASARNDPNLVWGGSAVAADTTNWLDFAPEVNGTSTVPAVLGREPDATIPPGGVTASVVDGDTLGDGDACDDGFNAGGAFNGNIVLVADAGPTCPPAFQAFFAEFEGAVGLIVVSTEPSGFPDMSITISNQDVNIPYVGIESGSAAAISFPSTTIRTSTTTLIGENNGQIRMFAPATFDDGSSVSHWTSDATGDLLMEPTAGDLAFDQVDLTPAAFQDMGWNLLTGTPDVILFSSFEAGE
ncbi:MAG: hypothetical protein QNJ40_08730 [Xanthomonadales bacterium]|nr:hypothetical protein [Xanthomonadales bacterium]